MLINSPGFIFTENGVEQQALLVDLRSVEGPVSFAVTVGSHTLEQARDARHTLGHHHRLLIDVVTEPTLVGVTALNRDGTLLSTQTVRVDPPRRQTVHLVHHAHQDMGWAERPTTMRERMVDYLDDVRELVEQTSQWPDESRFRWNVESAYLINDYEKAHGFERTKTILELVNHGLLEIGALHSGMCTELASSVQLNHFTDLALDLKSRFGVPIRTAMLNDVPGWAWNLPSVLSLASVEHLVWGPDPIRAMTHKSAHAPLYEAVGPDGRSVLVWQGPYAYIEAFPLVFQDLDDAEDLVERLMIRYLEDDYIHNQVLWHVAHDFNRPMLEVSAFVREWNSRWTYPRLRVSRSSDFFDAVREGGTAIPRLVGAFPDAWTDGVGSAVAHTAGKRAAARTADNAQRLAALAQVVDPEPQVWADRLKNMFPPLAMRLSKRPWIEYPQRELHDIFQDLNTLDEHTWGSVSSSDCYVGASKAHWLERDRVLQQLARSASIIELAGMSYLAAEALTEDQCGVVLVNPTQWPRREAVTAEVPIEWIREDGRLVLHTAGGDECAHDLVATDHEARTAHLLIQLAEEIPAFSQQALTVDYVEEAPTESTSLGSLTPAGDLVLENSRVSIVVDRATGRITSLKRRADDQEYAAAGGLFDFSLVIRGDEPFDVGEFDEEKLTGRETWRDVVDIGRWMHVEEILKPELVRNHEPIETAVKVSVEFDWIVADYLEATTRYELRRDSDIVRVHSRINKLKHHPREAAFFGLNFAIADPAFDVEGPGYTFQPGEQLSGSMYDHYCVHRWTRVRNERLQALLVCPDAPLVTCGGQHVDKWLEEPRVEGAYIGCYVFNHSWWTNFPNRQLGTVEVNYQLQVGNLAATIDCHQVAQHAISDGLATGSVGRYANPSRTAATSLLDFSSSSIEVEELSATGGGRSFSGLRAALRQTTAEPGQARLTIPPSAGSVAAARKVDLEGGPLSAVQCDGNTVNVKLGPHEFAIVEIEVARAPRKDFV